MGKAEKTGVYSNQEIIEARSRGHVVIEPFQETQVNGSSYDVRLGENFYLITNPELKPAVFNPYDQKQIYKHFDGPHTAKPIEEHADILGYNPAPNLDPQTQIILLRGGQRILGHTEEFIGIKPPGTTSMQARSSVGRVGVSVCLDAGWGDPGYVNRWTMEIYNNNEEDTMLVAVGTRIAQIVFLHTGAVLGEYSKLSGHYQTVSSDDLDTLKATWQPSDMLPKALSLD